MADKSWSVEEDVLQAFQKLKLSNASSAAIILKVIKDTQVVTLHDELPNTTLQAIGEDLSESNPRFIVFSYLWKRQDRVQYPLVFIYYKPENAPTELNMMYTRIIPGLTERLSLSGKVFELRDAQELTEEWLIEKLEKMKR